MHIGESTNPFPYSVCVNGKEPYRKYPTMRQMFYETTPSPLDLPYVMWFDDDSWIRNDAPPNWFTMIENSMATTDMLGDIWWRRVQGNQWKFIQDQPWYAGKSIQPRQAVNFVTGGWWTIRSALLKRHNWPIPELDHCGGDMLLGELFRQQGHRMRRFKTGVAINANEAGKNSAAPRRGFSQHLCGYDY
jgi:hypothetical protein